MDWLTGLFGDPATAPAAWGLLALVVLLLAVLGITRFRHMRSGMFIAGGRKHRLAVLDATAIDNRRRLVLVRRDDVEHLILIGGHNDLVVEAAIGKDEKSADPGVEPPRPVAASAASSPDRPEKPAAPETATERRKDPSLRRPGPPAHRPATSPVHTAAKVPPDDASLDDEMERLLDGLLDKPARPDRP